MLVHLRQVLTPEELHQARQWLAQGEWIDGRATAGAQAVQAKRNHQLRQDCEASRRLQERIEVLKGSASMLFGRGSTGGVVNQVSKRPFLMNRHEVNVSAGSGGDWRVTGDFILLTGPDAALRINTVVHQAERWGAEIDKKGIAPTYNWGIGTADEFQVGLYHLEYDNKPLYNHPWFLIDGKIKPSLPAKNYYGLDSDYNKGRSTYGSFMHIHRFGGGAELKTALQHGRFERDLWASVIRFGSRPARAATSPRKTFRRNQAFVECS